MVEPYSISGSFLKLEYLKTELNVENGTYAIAYKCSLHLIVTETLNDKLINNLLFCVDVAPLTNISGCVSFCVKLSRLTLYPF